VRGRLKCRLEMRTVENLRSIAQSRTEPARSGATGTELLSYWKQPSFFSGGKRLEPSSDRAAMCRAGGGGRSDRRVGRSPRPGREPTITIEAKAWLVSLACGSEGSECPAAKLAETRSGRSIAREQDRPKARVVSQFVRSTQILAFRHARYQPCLLDGIVGSLPGRGDRPTDDRTSTAARSTHR